MALLIVIPALDLQGGRVVQLVGGDPGLAAIRLDDEPVAVARRWTGSGAPWLHVVDLDQALSTGSNAGAVEAILRDATAHVQVGGGIRSVERARQLLDLGAARIVAGTRAVTEPAFLRALVDVAGPRVCVAVDGRRGRLVTHGWTRTTETDVVDAARTAVDCGAGSILFTEVSVEGALAGPDVEATTRVARAVDVPVVASGGVAGEGDLRALSRAGAWGAVVGMALYTGQLSATSLGRTY
ncbi:MAG: 1-(5-phosphoribosyl)-5-[(5-phosphoribosylamino)methylideneamino]imidazole-4-carboxamide isomerase [Thermoplasmatota archaeon]